MKFFEGSWKELLNEASKQNKPIFLDMYTDWCGPCKLMAKNIFTKENVGAKYNPLFISYKVNAEKGDGIEVAKKFNVSVYPTFLFLNSHGYLIHRVEGEREAGPFISLADEAVKHVADKNNLGNMEEQFNGGDRNPAFLRDYITRLTHFDVDNSKVLDEYFKGLPFSALNQEETLVFIGRNVMSTQSASLAFFIDNYDRLSKISKEKVAGHLYKKLVGQGVSTALGNKDVLALKQLMSFVDKIEKLDEGQRFYINRLHLAHADLVRDNKQVIAMGYKLTADIKEIPADSIRGEDARRFRKIMQPFLTGERDSTQIPGFSEERKFMQKMFTKDVTSKLYLVVQAFVKLPDTETQALKDALVWIRRCHQLEPDIKPYADLAEQLETRVRAL
jgi:thiol-disulfide isomerase/thioredoxin